MSTPIVSGLQSRSLTVTWAPPSQLNGVITHYSVCLCPSSVCSRSATLSSSLGPNPSPLPHSEGAGLNSDRNFRTTSGLITLSSSNISMATVNTGSNNSSNTVQGSRPNLFTKPFSSLRPGITEDSQSKSMHRTNATKDLGFTSFRPAEKDAANLNLSPNTLLSNLYHPSSSDTEPILKKDLVHSPISGCFSAASDSSSYPRSVTVPGNTTSYTFLDLLPYQTYNFQVQYNSRMLPWKCIMSHSVMD